MSNLQSNRTSQFIKNVIGSAILQIVTIVTGFISPKIMLTAFGSEVNGIVTSISQFISYLTLVEAGLSSATVYALYKPLADGDVEERDSVVSAVKIAYYRIGYLFVGLSLGLAFVYPFIGHTEVLTRTELGILVLVLCSNSAVNFFVLAKYRTLLSADQCGYYISISSAVQLIAHLAIVIVTVRLGFGVIIVRMLAMVSVFLTSIILAIIVRKRYGKINYNAKPNMKALDKRWDAMFLQLVGVITTSAPVIVMTAVLDFKQISVYGIYNMIAGSVSSCITVFTSGLGPGFGSINALGDKELLKKTTGEFRLAFYMLITVFYAIMLATLVPFVAIYTEDITDVNYIVPVFGVLITMRGLLENYRAPHGMLIFSFGQFAVIKKQTVLQAVMIVAGTIGFTYWLGLNGAMIALCIADIYMLIEFIRITPKHLVELSIPQNVRHIVQSLLIVFGVFLITRSVGYQPTNYWQWLLFACTVGIVSIVLTIGTYAITDRAEMGSLKQRFADIIKRKMHRVAKDG